MILPRNVINLLGRTFERLHVIEYAGQSEKHHAMWKCRCECGTETTVFGHALRHSHTKSCGCLSRERTAETGRANERHGHARRDGKTSSEYRSWASMIQRCENANQDEYRNYGGRGITICERWRSSFDDFLADMGRKPSPKHEIDRIENNGNYEPGNCRWATRKTQCRNVRSNNNITLNGVTRCLAEWVEITGLSRWAIRRRLAKGWSVESALTTPPQRSGKGAA